MIFWFPWWIFIPAPKPDPEPDTVEPWDSDNPGG